MRGVMSPSLPLTPPIYGGLGSGNENNENFGGMVTKKGTRGEILSAEVLF